MTLAHDEKCERDIYRCDWGCAHIHYCGCELRSALAQAQADITLLKSQIDADDIRIYEAWVEERGKRAQAQEEIADARKALGEHSKHEIGQTLKGGINNVLQILSLVKEERNALRAQVARLMEALQSCPINWLYDAEPQWCEKRRALLADIKEQK